MLRAELLKNQFFLPACAFISSAKHDPADDGTWNPYQDANYQPSDTANRTAQ
jgi:hypothetical protein